MSEPATPVSGRKPMASQSQPSGSEGISWFTIIGGVMGELLNNWGIMGALKKRGWGGTSGVRSTPSTPPPYGRSSYTEHEQIELSHFPNPCYLRVEALRQGIGHDFRATTLECPSWCDACAHLVFYHAVTCPSCNLTCHEQCQEVVSIDCKGLFPMDSEATPDEEVENLPPVVITEEKHEEETQEKDLLRATESNLEVSTLRRTVTRIQSERVVSSEIEEWVQKCSPTDQSLQIAKEKDGSYRGCLRIHLNLSRPINIVAGTRPPSIYDILQEDRTMERTLTSFYMPRDAVKAIHITSTTTTREVIVALLKKFKVVDNPQKFALYEKSCDATQTTKATLRKLIETECPLVLAISWSAQNVTNKRLVLQENDTADIQWDAFSLPELDNFLRILDKEEEEYKNQIRDKYSLLRKRMNDRLFQLTVAS